MRKGYLRFEIGIQSTNEETMKEINRHQNFEKIRKNILAIKNTVVIHTDLIAGLPLEDYNSFKKSFNDVPKKKFFATVFTPSVIIYESCIILPGISPVVSVSKNKIITLIFYHKFKNFSIVMIKINVFFMMSSLAFIILYTKSITLYDAINQVNLVERKFF